ncbi:MAG: type 4a pilus biogenesis protein PilO [candidate division Zixibacteria bacterium]|nr:type 4a pilus biogenesis protein PilO [candidate division Zixibacteria bacterium]
MDFKDAKTQKIAMGIVAFFVVIYFWHSRLYSKYDHQISQKSHEFERITTELRSVELKAKSLDALKLEYTDLIDRYHEIEALLPEVRQIPSFLVQLHTASSITGTRITSITPLPTESEKFYNIASFQLTMSGGYHDFGSFISYVANFPFIANVSDMEIIATEDAISKSHVEADTDIHKKNTTISAVFNLTTYYVKEEERLEELVI